MSCAMSSAEIVSNVFAETECLDWVAGQVARTDKLVAQVVQCLGGPGALGSSCVPEGCEEPLLKRLVLY